jgi:hypothetical protein
MKFLVLASCLFGTAAMAADLPANLTKVYSYECETTFLEGEGVSAKELVCTPFQQLGLLSARYHYYLNRSAASSNTTKQAGDEFYPDSVCNLELLRTRCTEKLPELKFGLSAVQDQTFNVAVNLSSAPGLAPELQGYGAPATKGKCAEGLQLVQAYRAVPNTITRPLPTNFVNANANLNDILVLAPAKKAPRFEVQRMRSNESCDEIGSCSSARFDQPVAVQRVDYKAGISICVVPKASIPNAQETFP